jgi:hypothetical protein
MVEKTRRDSAVTSDAVLKTEMRARAASGTFAV